MHTLGNREPGDVFGLEGGEDSGLQTPGERKYRAELKPTTFCHASIGHLYQYVIKKYFSELLRHLDMMFG